ncbi:hypothetical protein M404DRAFT_7141 [Pisolithus tinctorius Marx 270]|uniref:RING-type domain-containing protein n=1 Tax=Pisolithus tinctorius Marx 270 TaxID=870435 RepID=A0A0C3KQ65_PISTI|nr:hypothetical protein M404DRAFT_7141 [Pisolithus tinctorius Marx 270]
MDDDEGFVVISHDALQPAEPGTKMISIIGPLMDHNTALRRELATTRNNFWEAIQKIFAVAERDLSCAICLGLLCQPLTLPDCGHTYCCSCLESFFAKRVERRPSSQRTCPTCRNMATSAPVPVFTLHGLLDGLSAVAWEMRGVLAASRVQLVPVLDSFIGDT